MDSFARFILMLADLLLTIDHAQVLVQTERHAGTEILWTDAHVAQGFAWSQGHVAFGVPDHDGECRVRVDLAQGEVLDPQALWAVQVPFCVTGPVQIGALFDMHAVAVPPGDHRLTFQALPGEEDCAYVLRLTFSRDAAPAFRILKKGGDVTADTVLRQDAAPAR